MDRQCNYHIPGTLLGHLRHRAEGRGWRWRKLPPEAGTDPVGNSDTGAQRDSDAGAVTQRDTEPNSNTGAEPDSVGDAVTECGAVADTGVNSDAQRDGNPVAVGHTVAESHAFGVNTRANPDGNPVAQPDSVGNAQCDTDTEDCAGRLPDPNKGSGGRRAPRPAAAQAAGRGAGPHGQQPRPAD